jgi:hypothetical protein
MDIGEDWEIWYEHFVDCGGRWYAARRDEFGFPLSAGSWEELALQIWLLEAGRHGRTTENRPTLGGIRGL